VAPRAKNKAMPELRVVEVHIHVVMHDDMLMDSSLVMHFDGPLDYMCVNMTDGSVIDAVNDDGAAFLWCACGHTSRRGYTPR